MLRAMSTGECLVSGVIDAELLTRRLASRMLCTYTVSHRCRCRRCHVADLIIFLALSPTCYTSLRTVQVASQNSKRTSTTATG